jgi:glycosyltransferase involved in cell wall biosynthesis
VVAEALALGVPTVAADCISGPSQILGEGRFGRLVDVESVEHLVDAVGGHLRDPAPLAAKASAFQATARFTIDETAERYAALFDEVVRR